MGILHHDDDDDDDDAGSMQDVPSGDHSPDLGRSKP